MDTALNIFDQLVAGFLTAIEMGGTRLAGYSLAILSVTFVISYTQAFAPRLLQGTGSLSDALALPFLYFLAVAGYLYVLTHLIPMTTAALDTAVNWGLEMSGRTMEANLLRKPSFIVRVGLDVAKPIAQFDTTWQTIKTAASMVVRPSDLLIFWFILLAFMASAVHFGMTVIEFSLAVSLTYVLLPWAVWQASASLGEFAVGWIIGCLVRALVSCAIIGISIPLFPLILVALPGIFGIDAIVTRVVGTFFFAAIALAIPGRVANWASRAGLALTGSTIGAGAATFARWGMMGNGVVRGFSHLVGR